MNNVEIQGIEILTFSDDVSFGVDFNDDYNNNNFVVDEYHLTPGNDRVENALDDHSFYMREGNDFLQMELGADDVSVDGGAGNDTVDMSPYGLNNGASYGNASVVITDVETVFGGEHNDTVTITNANTASISMQLGDDDDRVNGSSNADTITVDGGLSDEDTVLGNDGDDNITTIDVESVRGGNGADTIDAAGNSAGSNDSVWGDNGNDTITARAGMDSIFGGSGDDSITIAANNDDDTIVGGSGNDTIDISANDDEDEIVFGNESAHPTGADVTVDSGFDTIIGFNAGADPVSDEDVLNFDALLENGGLDLQLGNLTAGIDLSGGGNNNVGVVWNTPNPLDISGNTFTTTAAPGRIAIEDNGEAIILFTDDADGDNVNSVTVAYVVDTDAGAGQNWDVNILGTVEFADATGLNGGTFDAANLYV